MKCVSSAPSTIFTFTMLGIVLLAAVVGYMKLVQHVVYEECSGHLRKYTRRSTHPSRIRLEELEPLDGWDYHIDHTASSDDDLVAFCRRSREVGFTDFYFLDKDGNLTLWARRVPEPQRLIDRIMIDGNNAVMRTPARTGSPGRVRRPCARRLVSRVPVRRRGEQYRGHGARHRRERADGQSDCRDVP